MDEDDLGSEKPESMADENYEAGKTEKEENNVDVSDEVEFKQVNDSKLGETDDMQIDESQGRDLERDETDKGEEIEAIIESENVVEGKEENKEILENEEAVQKIEDTTYVEGIEDPAEDKDNNESKNVSDEKPLLEIDDNGNREEDGKEKISKKRPREKSEESKNIPHPEEHEEEENENEHLTSQKNNMGVKPSSHEKEEQKTPISYSSDRPVRERKSVERLVATIEKDSGKGFHVEKGRGTALKDIPSVAYKLSRNKNEDTLKLLHTILFGRRGKASLVKNNLSSFSGFAWHDNDEKQMAKLKEKLDKCVKEKLVEFCDILDIPISKVNTRKEDIISKLVEFLLEPHAKTSELLAEKEQLSKVKKRKRSSKATAESSIASKSSSKGGDKIKSGENKSTKSASDEESGEETHDGDSVNGDLEKSENEIPEHHEAKDKENESEERSDEKKRKKKSSASKEKSAQKTGAKKETASSKVTPPKKAPTKSPSSRTKKTTKVSSSKKKDTPVTKPSTPKQSTPKESTGKKVLKAKEKIEEEIKPTYDELKNAVCETLKEVDFNTATFTDILALLAKQFNTDLTSRKSLIKQMIQDELTKLAEAEDDEEQEENNSAKKDVKA